jgi:predicted acetyltransferase
LKRAHARGIQPVTITCDDDNIGSIKIIEKNGGKYLSTSLSVESGRPVRRYVTVG